MVQRSERSNPKLKPRFPRLKLMGLRRKDDERSSDQWDPWLYEVEPKHCLGM